MIEIVGLLVSAICAVCLAGCICAGWDVMP